jgi:hypothetical protein
VDPRKRLLALQAVAWSGPALLLGSLLAGALTLPERTQPFARPVAWMLEPLRTAWLADRDGAVLLFLGIEALLLAVVWGFFGGALCRLAAVDLTGRGREPGRAALAFARRHLGALLGAPLLFAAAFVVPLGLAWLAAKLALLPGVVGGVLTPVAIVLVAALALVATVVGTLTAASAFLARPAVALDDGDLFDAVSRPYTYALAGLPRLLRVRLYFASGVWLGSGWRLARTLIAALLGLLVLETALGAERWGRVTAVVGALGRPADAERLGVNGFDLAAAGALVLAGAVLVALWLADLASRLACARTAAYLVLRRAVDRVPCDVIRTPPRVSGPLTAEAAGFTEIARVEAG